MDCAYNMGRDNLANYHVRSHTLSLREPKTKLTQVQNYKMISTKMIFVLVNVVGGVAVLGGYAWCLRLYPEHGEALWGGVHGTLRTIFTLSMVPAVAGYLTFCYVTIFQGDTVAFGKVSGLGVNIIVILAILFLASAAMWMPALIAYIRSGVRVWWVVCVASLWVTALSLLAMTGVTAISSGEGISVISKNASVAGLAYITFHCLVMDAIVWVLLFNE